MSPDRPDPGSDGRPGSGPSPGADRGDSGRGDHDDGHGASEGGPVVASAGGRLHFGFANLSLAHERLYGGIGAAVAEPRVVLRVRPADRVDAPPVVESAVREAVDRLDVGGAAVRVDRHLPRHVGLGSGTRHALAAYAGVARAHGVDPDLRAAAPALGRGGRSGVGVATLRTGGFVVDAGHPTRRFTADPPAEGDWTVPPVAARHDLPEDWRALLVRPDVDGGVDRGRSGDREDRSMASVVERADPQVADRIAAVLTRRLLPAVAEGDLPAFGAAVERVGRLNGSWFADEQGGVYRPPVGAILEHLRDSVVAGAGQSSWGPTAYGVLDRVDAEAAREAGRRALSAAGVDGDVRVVAFDDCGLRVRENGD